MKKHVVAVIGCGNIAKKAVDHLDNNPHMQRIVTCYNISEWAEGGPGLQPNVQDGFGYLDAIGCMNTACRMSLFWQTILLTGKKPAPPVTGLISCLTIHLILKI